MGLPVKGHSLKRVDQLPVAKDSEPQSLLLPREKELVGGDTVGCGLDTDVSPAGPD